MTSNLAKNVVFGMILAAFSGAMARAVVAAAAPETAAVTANAATIARGAYLVTAMGCHDCHTPLKMGAHGPEPDMSRALTGHPADMPMPPAPALPPGPWAWSGAATSTAFAGPWGVSFTANLTPDPETGLGKWTEEMFVRAMRTGRHEGKGRPILPPMPFQNVGQLNDEDISAVFAYLQSLPPVVNRVPQPVDPSDGQP
ncbi:MAG: cytochrome c [Vicinamibacterales bacterium]